MRCGGYLRSGLVGAAGLLSACGFSPSPPAERAAIEEDVRELRTGYFQVWRSMTEVQAREISQYIDMHRALERGDTAAVRGLLEERLHQYHGHLERLEGQEWESRTRVFLEMLRPYHDSLDAYLGAHRWSGGGAARDRVEPMENNSPDASQQSI